jgi:hypothetical protein
MGGGTVSPASDRDSLGGGRPKTIVFVPEDDPRLEGLRAFGVIALLSLGLGSAVSLAVFLLS